jgi:hypothetical protein
MAATVAQIREGIAANLAALTQVYDGLTVSAYLQATPVPPLLHVFPEKVEYDKAMGRGLDEWQFAVHGFFGLTSERDAQTNLDLMLAPAGTWSVKAAVESDDTLGGLLGSGCVSVTEATGYQLYELEGRGTVLGCIWTVSVMATGK